MSSLLTGSSSPSTSTMSWDCIPGTEAAQAVGKGKHGGASMCKYQAMARSESYMTVRWAGITDKKVHCLKCKQCKEWAESVSAVVNLIVEDIESDKENSVESLIIELYSHMAALDEMFHRVYVPAEGSLGDNNRELEGEEYFLA